MTIHYNCHSDDNAKTRSKINNIDNFTTSISKYPFLYPYCNQYQTHITNKHWQLRALVKFDSQSADRAYYAYENEIRAVDLLTGDTKNVTSGHFPVKCFAESDGLIISGGSKSGDKSQGLVDAYNVHTGTELGFQVGEVINNAVTVDKLNNGQFCSFVCNNDQNLYKLDISNSAIKLVNKLNIGYQLNYSCLSNDGRMALVSGDSNKITMVSPKSGEVMHRIHTDTKHDDCGFSMEFQTSDAYFAAAFQSGKTFLYDVRNLQDAIHVFHSTKPEGKTDGAFRHLKFTNGATDDYLFITEHQGKVHIVDIRNFENHRIITIPTMYEQSSHPGDDTNNTNDDDHNKDDNGELIFSSRNINKPLVVPAMQPPSPMDRLNFPIINDYHDVKYTKHIKLQKYYHSSGKVINDYSFPPINSVAGNSNSTQGKYDLSQYSYISDYEQYHDSKYDILGMDWKSNHHGSRLIVAGKSSITKWEIDCWSRRGFGDFEFS
ncbi:Gid11 protein [Saccharomycopsis crataegensis]|uniref:Gid11 protein n=1 Tax=Saccharomycopsis crataegensis TaxID=43959 RepID=A0AAV5QVV8_9ASCO|nr:Gid11 protein [Saccharomycopsis crataegensis]